MEPIPVGSVVQYRGSHTHGEYVVVAHRDPAGPLFPPLSPEILADAYPDGVAYEIWLRSVLRRFGNRMYMVTRVRRRSLTPTGETENEIPED